MREFNLEFSNEREKKRFVRREDRKFDRALGKICRKIAMTDKKIVTLSGPTCSGKTMAAEKIIACFKKRGKEVIAVSLDDFFRDAPSFGDLTEEKPDYDSVKALDLPELERCVKSLLALDPTRIPIFEFKEQRRVGYKTVDPDENTVLLFEGIQGMYREVVALLPKEEHLSIFISPEGDRIVNGEHFTPDEVRLCRRLVRDRAKRGNAPDFVMYLWDSVRANEIENIDPYINTADLFIDSTFAYEMGVLKAELLSCVAEIPDDSERKERAEALAAKFAAIPEISPAYLPENSVYHEFIDTTIDARIKQHLKKE